jgi:hypothetical protein
VSNTIRDIICSMVGSEPTRLSPNLGISACLGMETERDFGTRPPLINIQNMGKQSWSTHLPQDFLKIKVQKYEEL